MSDPLRHHRQHADLHGAFGSGGFGKAAEAFARFFGTPRFILGQTAIVATWLILNATVGPHWDPYPYILLNLMFSLQAAYAAPLILLAQTRQADRDKAAEEADAKHREAIAEAQAAMLRENTELTQEVKAQTDLLDEIHRHVTALAPTAGWFDPSHEDIRTAPPTQRPKRR